MKNPFDVIKPFLRHLDQFLNMENIRPPLGLTPKHIWLELRLYEIIEAIFRYAEAKHKIPDLWIKQYNDIIDQLNTEQNEKRNT